MNENVERLKELKEDLEAIERSHAGILAHEPAIAHPVHQAATEARRRFHQVTEPPPTSLGFVP